MISNAAILERYIIKGKIILQSPLLIGSGTADNLHEKDILTIRNDKGIPYIPATSFMGALKHWFFESKYVPSSDKTQIQFWGGNKNNKNNIQSSFIVSDLYPFNDNVEVLSREGIRLDKLKGTAVDKGLYSYEIIPSFTAFKFEAEIIIRKDFNKEEFEKTLGTILSGLMAGDVKIGAMTNKGLGRIKLKDVHIFHYNYKDKESVINWLAGNDSVAKDVSELTGKAFKSQNKKFEIKATFEVNNSLIIRSYPNILDAPDMINIADRDEKGNLSPVISGTSLKGALVSRIKRILCTLDENISEDLPELKEFFGFVNEGNGKYKSYKSNISVTQSFIKNPVQKVQRRIKVNRFTGGTIGAALFESEPVWKDPSGTTTIQLSVKLNKKKESDNWQAGLLLLALKDLWNMDLPLGGEKSIGRGRLKGVSMQLFCEGKNIEIKHNDSDNSLIVTKDDAELLEGYVKDLVEFVKQKGGNSKDGV